MADTQLHKPATAHTAACNAMVSVIDDQADFERASRGFIASHPTGHIVDQHGRTVINVNNYNFLEQGSPAPDTVNPSLWRHAQLNHIHGLFEVRPDVYQVRGYDISNITFIKGNTGWIVIDPLTTAQTAKDSYELITAQLGHRPITAVIYTHSHTDHFGGVLGVISEEDVTSGRCIVVAPEHFMHETVGENVIAGPAMGRRALFQFGPFLPPGPTGHVDAGLGTSIPIGAPGLIAPTHDITRTGEEMVIDGVRVIFQLTPESEAPAEMNFYFPDLGALCMAENCNHTMHNLIPIRGALVRNAMNWSKYINEAMELFGGQAEVLFTSHHWPRWGNEDLNDFLTKQRDLYKWMHDQTMRHANKGLVATEIAEPLELPEEFKANEHTRGFYGDLVHNAKAVYQRYLSWYDGNPANLKKYPPVEAGKRYVELAGGADALLKKAQQSFDDGDYRWVAELLNHLVFADPTNDAARQLQADTFEQLGYQCESATFRNAYLNAAQELRHGPPQLLGGAGRGRGLLRAMSVEQVFDAVAVRLISENVGGLTEFVNWTFTDINEKWVLGLSNRTLFHSQGRHDPRASVTVTLPRTTLIEVVTQETTFMEQIQAGNISIEGDPAALLNIFGNLDAFTSNFHVVEP